MPDPIRAALALGSGGARGYAHIGVIEVLAERGIEMVNIAGSSMGALVGGLYAAGKLDAYTEWVRDLSQFDVLRLLDVSLSAPGVIRAEKIFARVHELVGDVLIEDLPMPFTAVATDLAARKPVWFQRGQLEIAVRASIGMPGVFTPVMLHGRVLVDGGLMDPVPIGPTASTRADVTVAVDLGGERSSGLEVATADDGEEHVIDDLVDRFRRGAAHVLDRELVRSLTSRFGGDGRADPADADADPPPPSDFEALPAGLTKFDVMNQSLEAMQSVLTRYRLAGNPPDVLVRIPKDACRTLTGRRR
jgi:NTE family protein